MNGGSSVDYKNTCMLSNQHDFEEIIDSPIFIAGDKELLDKEISTNMWDISFDDTLIKYMAMDNLLQFIDNLLNKKKQQLSELNVSCGAIFYMWFDEMACQLRFNLISDVHKKLPFGCQLNIVDSPHSILTHFLQSQCNQEILWDELEEINDGYDNAKDIFILNVFVKKLEN